MPLISGAWAKALEGEFHKPYYKKLFETVGKEYATHQIFPAGDDIFNVFHFTPLDQVKVVILGQDPYHGDGQAHGLCFSVKPDVEIPPSLVNIYKELEDDLDFTSLFCYSTVISMYRFRIFQLYFSLCSCNFLCVLILFDILPVFISLDNVNSSNILSAPV